MITTALVSLWGIVLVLVVYRRRVKPPKYVRCSDCGWSLPPTSLGPGDLCGECGTKSRYTKIWEGSSRDADV